MNIPQTVSRFVFINLLTFLIVIVGFYSYTVNLTYNWGSDDTFHYFLTLRAEEAIRERSNPSAPIDNNKSDFVIYENYSALPEEFRKKHPASQMLHSDLLFYESKQAFHYILVYSPDNSGELLYIEHPYYYLEDNYDLGISIYQLVVLSVLLSILLSVLFYYRIVHRLTSQIHHLAKWCQNDEKQHSLTTDKTFVFSELRKVAIAFSNAIQSLKTKTEREKNFLKSLSHELRTPLAITKASLEIINKQNPNLPQGICKKLEKIEQSNNNMCSLSDSLLHLWSEKSIQLAYNDTDIGKIVSKSCQQYQHFIKDKNIDLELPYTTVEVKAPSSLLEIIIVNLIKNAFQYTERGTVTVNYDSSLISVANCVDSDQSLRLTSSEKMQYGYGVGLFIVESICQKLHWRLETSHIDNQFIAKIHMQ